MDITTALFYVFSAVLLASAVRVITAKSTVHSALFLILSFFSASCLWMLLKAEFLAITLVLVYIGAVMVLFLFVVMMLDFESTAVRESIWKHLPVASLVGAVIALEIAAVLMGGFRGDRADAARPQGLAPPGRVAAGAREEGGPPAHRQGRPDRRSAVAAGG